LARVEASQRLAGHIKRLLACTGERDMYPILRDMLFDKALGINLNASHVVVDTNLDGQGVAPDLAVYSEVGGKGLRTPDYLFGIIEAKPGKGALSNPDKIFGEKLQYVQAGTRWFFLVDQTGAARRDLEIEDAAWEANTWSELADPQIFRSLFDTLSLRELKLEVQLAAFEAGTTRVAYRNVETFGRRRFIGTIREVAQLLNEAVGEVVGRSVTPSVREALALIEPMAERWGPPAYDWAPRRGHPIEFRRLDSRGELIQLGREATRDYATAHIEFAEAIAPHLAAFRLEIEALPTYAAKQGADEVSFARSDKASKRAIATFVYETASLVLSRMLMVRFSEDHDFLTRQISNGGVRAFAGYAQYFNEPYQALLKQAYKSAHRLYRDLFDAHSLDWVLDSSDTGLSRAIQRAMLLLSRWNFRTVRGDILSGVYDHYLEVEKRRELGEVFTRPEIARYVLQQCGWSRSKTLLDPACGTGTFLVEGLRQEVERLRAAGAFDLQNARSLLEKLHGLDINPFSVSLSQIQILWHMIDLFEGRSADEIREIAQVLLPLIRVDGGLSSLETMGTPMAEGGQAGLELGTGRGHAGRRRTNDFPIKYRRINGASYDVVVGNPPYVRAHRRTKEALAAEYSEVAVDQYDLYILFLYRALRWWLKPGGRLGFIVPMAVLDAGYAQQIRRVLSEFKLIEIIDLELLRKKTFHGVKRPVVVLIIEKSDPSSEDEVTVTTVSEAAYDADADYVDMTSAARVTLPRWELNQTTWLPPDFVDNPVWRELVDVATGERAELMTKVKPDDRNILAKIAIAPRLAEAIDLALVKKNDASIFKFELEPHEAKLYRRTLLLQDGLKLGSTRATSGDGPLKVYKGLNIFPGRLLGAPIGGWLVGSEKESRIYRYREVLDTTRLFAARQIGQSPTITPVPDGAVFQNTALLLQLKAAFPLNVWVVSRVLQFYCAKVLRASIIEDLTAHWYKRQLCLLPMPIRSAPDLKSKLMKAGEELFVADRGVSNRYLTVQAVIASGSQTLRQLIRDSDPRAGGIDLNGVPKGDATLETFEVSGSSILGGAAWQLDVPNSQLRKWLSHLLTRELEGGPTDLNRGSLLDMAVPDALDDACSALDAIASTDPDVVFESALAALDAIVGEALDLGTEEIAYIQTQMREDPFLRHINPMWEKRGLSRQAYRDVEDD
jgi:hypothetical protein